MNPNRYATKKTVAQGMLDIALLTSNASQLRYLLKVGDAHEYYEPMLALIISSIVLQVLNGLFQLIMGPINLNKDDWKTFLEIINYLSTISAAAIALIDVIKSGFNPPGINAL
eukprot:TRINITY_DN12215_c0_g1_i1.p1 TRINITY_DN12215_c0_g1~~TRINITY_DN12215_c0_g1_i1.p1  ORF type:complete len:126 (-),score=21.46 TRINITY_DN12215_c0_g1_i1:139-477(-)